jgi:hypothetical protein
VGLQVSVCDQQRTINRDTTDLFTILSDFGGLFSLVRYFGILLFAHFSQKKMTAIMADRLFTKRTGDDDHGDDFSSTQFAHH